MDGQLWWIREKPLRSRQLVLSASTIGVVHEYMLLC
jgi:hypothetical protein